MDQKRDASTENPKGADIRLAGVLCLRDVKQRLAEWRPVLLPNDDILSA